jgi:hypothetical protein
MSEKNHPNINAAGLVCGVFESFYENIRGDAKKDEKRAIAAVKNEIATFASHISNLLDEEFKKS